MDKMNPLTYNNCIKLRLMKGRRKRGIQIAEKTNRQVCTAALIVINMGIFFLLSFLGNPENAVFMIKYGAMYPPVIFEICPSIIG